MTTTYGSHAVGLFAGVFVLACSGCAYMPGAAQTVENDFGNSVRNMVSSQTYDPQAAENPPQGVTEGLDGQKAGLGLETYRTEAGTGTAVRAPIGRIMTD